MVLDPVFDRSQPANISLSITIGSLWPNIVASGCGATGRAQLVYRLLNPLSFAAGQLAVFQGASEVPISVSYGLSEQRGKQPTGRGPEGCVENGPAAAFARRLRIVQIMRPLTASPARTALPAAHFERNETQGI